jgi:hypothetical protein
MPQSLYKDNPIQINTDRDGDGLQHYDQVCALSQHVINKNFEKLFERRPDDVSKIDWEGSSSATGNLKGTMLAPQIKLSLESVSDPEVYYLLRYVEQQSVSAVWSVNVEFKRARFGPESKIYFSSTSSISISGWNIALTAKLKLMTASVDPSLSADDQAKASDALEEIEEDVEFKFEKPTKELPGEYSIHRLFASIPSKCPTQMQHRVFS